MPPFVVAVKVTGVPGVSTVDVKLVVSASGLIVIADDADATFALKSVTFTLTV